MKYDSSLANSIHAQAAPIFRNLGFHLTKGATNIDPWSTTLGKIKEDIDQAFAIVVETAEFSWWIAFELFCSVERKMIIPLIPEDSKDSHAAQSFMQMFPNLEKVPYVTYGRRHFDDHLAQAIGKLLQGASAWAKAISEAFLSKHAPPRPDPVVEPWLGEAFATRDPTGPEAGEFYKPETLFARWRAAALPLRAAVIGPPGAGKTLLLTEFARFVEGRRRRTPQTTSELDPVVVSYVRPNFRSP